VTQAAYLGPWLWKLTAEKAGSFDVTRSPAASPGIESRARRKAMCAFMKTITSGPDRGRRAKLDGQFELIFETADLIEPDPFPKGYQ